MTDTDEAGMLGWVDPEGSLICEVAVCACMCMYVCMCVCMYVYIYICVCVDQKVQNRRRECV